MSNSKIRSWIYRAIAFLIAVGIAWFLLLRESTHTQETLTDMYSLHQAALEKVSKYLLSKKANLDITDFPTIDNDFNIPYEDSNAYRDFCEGIYELMESDFKEIIAEEDTIRFVTYKSGGFLVDNHAELVCGNAPIMISGAPRDVLADGNWYYYIIKED